MNQFDWQTYVSNYKDLQKAGINTKEKAYCHWIVYGKKEGRTYLNTINLTIDKIDLNTNNTNQEKYYAEENKKYIEQYDVINYSYYNIYNKIVIKNLFDMYIKIHNKEKNLNTIIKSKVNLNNIKIGIDIVPTYHDHYSQRGVGYLVKNYFEVLSSIPNINIIPLSKHNYTEQYDIIHFTCPPVINEICNDNSYDELKLIRNECIIKKNAKIFIMTIYDLIPHIFKNAYKPSQIYYDFFDLLKDIDLIIAISNSTKKDLIKFFNIPENKIYVIYPPLKNNFTKLIGNDKTYENNIIEKYKITKNYILYIGGADFRKNIDNTIQGFTYAKNNYNIDSQLVIVCAEGKKLQEHYSNQLERSDVLLDDVIFTDFVQEFELYILYNKAHVSIFTSLYEGFGMPIIEAIKCKIPVIVSNTSSMIELFELSSKNLLITDPYDVKNIADTINYIFKINKKEYDCHINNSLEILPLFSNQMIQIELKNAYTYALSKKNT